MTITTSVPDRGEFALSIAVSADHPRSTIAADLSAAMDGAPTRLDGAQAVQVWLTDVAGGDDDLVSHVVRPYRDLLQLRRSLPAEASCISTRGFDLDHDAGAFISINNRAFSWHPEQSGYTHERLNAAAAEPGFNPEGFRILEIDGRMAGFCWTKIHPDETPPVGEIYVIAIDPDFHGQGHGGPMTLAGLEWLTDQGLTVAKLYVESDNHAALRTYERLGFRLHGVNRAYTSAPA